jgi:hypothetical protein
MKRIFISSLMGFLMMSQASAAQTGMVGQNSKATVDKRTGDTYGALIFGAAVVGACLGTFTGSPMDEAARQQLLSARDISADNPTTWWVAGACLTIPLAVGYGLLALEMCLSN